MFRTWTKLSSPSFLTFSSWTITPFTGGFIDSSEGSRDSSTRYSFPTPIGLHFHVEWLPAAENPDQSVDLFSFFASPSLLPGDRLYGC